MSIIAYLTTIRFAAGALVELAQDLAGLGVRRPLVITDPGVIQAGLLERLTSLRLSDECVFADCPANPTEAAAIAAAERYRAAGCDGLIALGGGSPIDLAKAAALLASHPGPLARYATTAGGQAEIRPALPPLVAIPTTAGTGSEVGRAALIVMADGRKRVILSPHLLPRLALCDPDLTLGLPAAITSGSGMDAIAHCVEALLSPRFNPPADAIALDGLARGAGAIRRAVEQPRDAEARAAMMMAALEGGLAFQKGLGAVHALSHPLGALRLGLHHGTLNAVLLPAVLRFNAGHAGAKPARIAAALGLSAGTDLAAWFEALNADLGLPAGLAAMGVQKDVLAAIAEQAAEDPAHQTNPRPASTADYRAILDAAYAPGA